MKNITFEDFFGKWFHVLNLDQSLTARLVSNVDNPILIDQCYSTAAAVCAEFPSNLTISDVHCMLNY